jgi:ketosteroid isomerase-like protein
MIPALLRLNSRRTPLWRSAFLAAALLAGAACTRSSNLTPAEVAAVDSTLAAYRNARIANDRSAVLNTLSEDITLFVPGGSARNVSGRDNLATFWFPPSDTIYRIARYEITDQQVHGSGSMAVVQGHSVLAFDTVIDDSVVSSTTSASDFLTIMRNENGQWRIFRQMYAPRQQ